MEKELTRRVEIAKRIIMICSTFLRLVLLVPLAFGAPSPPTLVYPLQLQRPPVARVSQSWRFALLPGTFNSSTGLAVSLSSTNLPSWVTFNAMNGVYSGMPIAGDEGSFPITILANSSGVAKGTMDTFVLLVVDAMGPTVKLSIATQIPGASSLGDGALLTPDGALRIPPGWSFSLGFQQYTFATSYYSKIYYTAYETGTTTIMNWLVFDNNTVTFDGVAPVRVGEYSVTLFGSTVFGYGDITQTFRLSVGYHSFELLGNNLPGLNTSTLDSVAYTIPLENVKLDNVTVNATDLTSITVGLTAYPFLSYAPTTRLISGTVPTGLIGLNGSIPIVLTDNFGDTITTTLPILVLSSIFTTNTIPTQNLTAGLPFSIDLARYASSREANYSVAIIPTTAVQWLNFNTTSLLLGGTPPNPIPYGKVAVTIIGKDPLTALSSSANLVLNLFPSSTAPPVSPTSSAVPIVKNGGGGLSHQAQLGIGISLGLLGLIGLVGLLVWWRRRYTSEEGELRQARRDSSFQLFNAATVGAAQTKRDTTTTGTGEKLPEVMVVVPISTSGVTTEGTPVKPKRFDLMKNLFKSSSNPIKPDGSMISLPISQNSLYGLGLGDGTLGTREMSSTTRSIGGGGVTVLTDRMGGTYDPRERGSSTRIGGESDLEREESWESRGSSSLFYAESEDENGIARGRGRAPMPPGSAPRQRRDFLPMPSMRRDISSPLGREEWTEEEVEGDEEHISAGGIRMDTLHSSESGSSSGIGEGSSNNSHFDPALFPPQTISQRPSAAPTVTHLVGAGVVGGPRLIPFEQARLAKREIDGKRPTSLQAIGEEVIRITNRDSAMEDADEDWEAKRRSKIYHPSRDVESVVTPIFFNSTAHLSPNPSEYTEPSSPYLDDEEGDQVRLVPSPLIEQSGSPSSSPSIPSGPISSRAKSSHQSQLEIHQNRRTATSSMYSNATAGGTGGAAGGGGGAHGEPSRIMLQARQGFKFTPRLNPAPYVSISAPSGSNGPPKTSYVALIDHPGNARDRTALPTWINFDSSTLELWGTPKEIGFLHIIILESKKLQRPGSPTRSGSPTRFGGPEEEREKSAALETVVGRFVLEVADGVDEGEWEPITY